MQYARPSSDIENPGGWTVTPLWEKIDEEPFDDGDYLISPRSATGDSFTIGLSGVIDPGVHTDHVVRIRVKTGVSGTFKFELLQGAVVIKDSGDVVLTTAFAEYNMTLSEAEASNITDYTALRVRVTAVATQKNQRQNVSWIRVDVPSVSGEEHSGSGSISGNGSPVGTAEKGGRGSALKSAGGTLFAFGLAGMLGIASVAGGGSQFVAGEKSAMVSASISNGGSQVAVGKKSTFISAAISGGGSLIAEGQAIEHSGIAAITGSGVFAGIGIKQAPGDSTVTGGGSIIAAGPMVESQADVAAAVVSVVPSGSQISGEKRDLLLIGNPDDIIFLGKKKPILISRK